MTTIKRVDQVFGVSNTINPDSYVDRGSLDEELLRLQGRTTHIALRGESKCGKSWLRQKVIPNALVVQCRFGKSVTDLYTDALSQLDIKLVLERSGTSSLKGTVEASGSIGIKILGKLGLKASAEVGKETGKKEKPVGKDITDLRFIADILKASERRLVIEDFHYLSIEQRKIFAFDLKALWDYGVFVVVVGIWSKTNMILSLNSDLTARVEEVSISWSKEDLKRVLERGGQALGINFSEPFKAKIVGNAFGNVSIVQRLVVSALDELGIEHAQNNVRVNDLGAVDGAALVYAGQLDALYQKFAEDVSGGIRKRDNATGIYAHAMAVIFEAGDEALLRGLHVDDIYEQAHARQPRIQKSNLKAVLAKFEELQVDDDRRGLVLSYNAGTERVEVVDRTLLLYRRYCTVKWPWEDLIAEFKAKEAAEQTEKAPS